MVAADVKFPLLRRVGAARVVPATRAANEWRKEGRKEGESEVGKRGGRRLRHMRVIVYVYTRDVLGKTKVSIFSDVNCVRLRSINIKVPIFVFSAASAQ